MVALGVRSYQIDDPERIGIYSLNRVAYADGRLRITAEPGLAIDVEVDDLHLIIADLPNRPTGNPNQWVRCPPKSSNRIMVRR